MAKLTSNNSYARCLTSSIAVSVTAFLITLTYPDLRALSAAQLQPKLKAMSSTLNVEQSIYISKTYALFRIIDPKYLRKVLEKAPDYEHFHARVDDWIEKNKDQWNDAMTLVSYCNELRQKDSLGTDIDALEPDVRWELFITYGLPMNRLVLPCECNGGSGSCNIWTFTWASTKIGKQNRVESCRSRHGEEYPTEIIIGDKQSFPLAYPLWPIVNYSKFPTQDGKVDLWFSIWVPGNQFTRATLDKGQFAITVDLYDSSKTVLVASDSSIANLQIIRGILEATERQDRHLINAMSYVGFPGVDQGRYHAHLTVTGDRTNEGDKWVEIVVPSECKIGDLLILSQTATTGENLLPGIVRGTNEGLYDNPEPVFASGSLLHLYAEAILPDLSEDAIQVWVTLLPLPEIAIRNKTVVEIGETVVVADSSGKRFMHGEWQSSRDQEYLDSIAHLTPDPNVITLLKKRYNRTRTELVVDVTPRLGEKLKSGRYLLSLSIMELGNQSYFLSARRVIYIASSVTQPTNNRYRNN